MSLMDHHDTVFCYEPAFTLKLTLTAVIELEECEEVGGVSSPRYKGGYITPNLHSVLCPASQTPRNTTVKLSGHTMRQMESVRLKINEQMASVGEEILCVLDKQQRGADVCSVKFIRVFVLERLSAAAEYLCNLFQRETE